MQDFCKKYLAVVKGKVADSGEFVDKLERLNDGNTIVSKNGKASVLNYKLIEYNKNRDCSLVEVNLKTGRHHQIRVQFASRGHFLCGDQRYGVQDKTQIALFAYYLSFTHPVSKEKMVFTLKPNRIGHWTMFTL